ncbi:MAG: hypothetical protein KF858_05095 [Candidatus Sumerlaeia bacterium]|nr:hypothetical protein [Candidatus Sumerlaeia bacterium]
MFSIYGSQMLRAANAFGIGRKRAPDPEGQKAVCFSEVPPGNWKRLVDRRKSSYGLGFRKEFIRKNGGGPIWYVWKGTPHWQALDSQMKLAKGDPSAPIWKVTPMIDAPGQYGRKSYDFDWEREWRVVGDLRFQTTDVAFLFIPEYIHEQAEDFFEGVAFENTGPSYNCPFIDPLWSRKKVNDAIANFKKRRWRSG